MARKKISQPPGPGASHERAAAPAKAGSTSASSSERLSPAGTGEPARLSPEAALQRALLLGHRVPSATVSIHRTPEDRIQRISAEELISAGKIWNAKVWVSGLNDNYKARDTLIQNMNKWITATGFTVGRGFQPYDPVVRPARKYTAIATDLDKNAVANAKAFADFLAGKLALEKLPNKPLQELALITCFAEVGRGYSSSLGALKEWVGEIAAGNSEWSDVKVEFDPALTYAEDAKAEWE